MISITMGKSGVTVLFFTVFLIVATVINGLSQYPLLLIISFDGFRHDFFNTASLPNFEQFRKSGVYIPEVTNVFITQTYPSHYTIATGRYQEDHGVLGNTVYDPLLQKELTFRSPEMFNYNAEVIPLWSQNEEQGEGRHSGTMMWIGGEHEIHGTKNTYSVVYNKSVSFRGRLDTVLNWFTNNTHPANLVFLYYNEPDSTGHTYGVDSDEMKQALLNVDQDVGYLLKQVEERQLSESLNIILTSDHGMINLNPNYIDFSSIVDVSKVKVYGSSPFIQLKVINESETDEIYEGLKSKEADHHFKVYLKKDIPERWHIKKNRRIQDIILHAEKGYEIQIDPTWNPKGNHGYDNILSEMHPFLMGVGPAFRKGFVYKADFSLLDIYPLACQILNLEPRPHNGTVKPGEALLRSEESTLSVDAWIIAVIVLSLLVTIILSSYLYKKTSHLRRSNSQDVKA